MKWQGIKYTKVKLSKDCELMVSGEVPFGKIFTSPVNKTREFKAGTIIEFTGGNDAEYYIRIGNEKERPMITISKSELKKIEVESL